MFKVFTELEKTPLSGLLQRLEIAEITGNFTEGLVDDLRSALIRSLQASDRRAIQAGLLRQAASLLSGPPYQRAEQLAAVIRRWSGHPADPIKALLYRATQTGLRLPSSPRQIYRIISEN